MAESLVDDVFGDDTTQDIGDDNDPGESLLSNQYNGMTRRDFEHVCFDRSPSRIMHKPSMLRQTRQCEAPYAR